MIKVYILFFALIIFSFFLSLMYGQVYIPLKEIFSPHGYYSIILFKIRIPTSIAAILIGASLAVSGAIMQMLLRNPLIDPYISGTASGGAFGAVLSYFLLAFNLPFSSIIYISPIIAFIFALISTLITIIIGKKTGVYGIIIGGIVISYVFSSMITFMLTEMESRFPQVPPLIYWLLGSIQVVGFSYDYILLGLTLFLVILGYIQARKIDAVNISDELAYSKGINPNKFRIFWVLLISIIVGYIVSQVGIIGFVGIIVPHIVRKIAGGSSVNLIPLSALLGSSIMTLSNIIANGAFGMLFPDTAITSILAAPIIIYVLVKGNVNQEY
ncbi:iron chelate uptake ABC transporter family permease subunit [Acidianus sulfidivorans JP7]|uniref:Iron ABC transporter n=1 Tax=Acidianus sulfidivorans JP7 TaxID=619593 RepID=A0A2U9IL21_9CREN|nr:iron ABC transporter permease [Acidianus sulfidivorans]AWR96739.1 iron chelate uptake ABC transporter family permease subunit [Acidianus sulfidivorans JP7]